jgi:hypothetical protein
VISAPLLRPLAADGAVTIDPRERALIVGPAPGRPRLRESAVGRRCSRPGRSRLGYAGDTPTVWAGFLRPLRTRVANRYGGYWSETYRGAERDRRREEPLGSRFQIGCRSWARATSVVVTLTNVAFSMRCCRNGDRTSPNEEPLLRTGGFRRGRSWRGEASSRGWRSFCW